MAITAFVGEGARAYIPRPRGVEIICWPKAGGTNPLELRRLKQMGARIRFADSLHMKVYWAACRGVIITSANLSTNALGSGGLKEIGVLLPPDALDIDELISSLKARPFNKDDIQKLEEADRKLQARYPHRRNKADRVDYKEWYSLPARSEWKLGWWDHLGSYANTAKEIVHADFNEKTPKDFISCRQKDYRQSDWILSFLLTKKGASKPVWMFVDFVVKVGGEDKKAYEPGFPYQAIQVWTPRHYPPPPFEITPDFRKAFCAACLSYGLKRLQKLRTTRPPEELLRITVEKMKK